VVVVDLLVDHVVVVFIFVVVEVLNVVVVALLVL